MKVVLATGIYPPEIGGPATYVRVLGEKLCERGIGVTVVTYGRLGGAHVQSPWKVVRVGRWGGPVFRWWRYARALQKEGVDADIIYGFSSVSAGVPLLLSFLRKPKRLLRLGGDFLWERYTDWGSMRSLAELYQCSSPLFIILRFLMQQILCTFDHLVFSTEFQQQLYRAHYKCLPSSSVLENAVPYQQPTFHIRHDPLRLLFLGRFVRFKNLPVLLRAVARLPHHTLTLVGDGPLRGELEELRDKLHIRDRVQFFSSIVSNKRQELFNEYDLLILPSTTEISPNVALEARSCGLPVLLSNETGLSKNMLGGIAVRPLRTVEEVMRAILEFEQRYAVQSREASTQLHSHSWDDVTDEHVTLFRSISHV